MSGSGWIGVDFDGTLATYDRWRGADHCGEPIGDMVFRVKKWLADGWEVRIFTARCFPLGYIDGDGDYAPPVQGDDRALEAGNAVMAIRAWCEEHIGKRLTVTCIKDYGMVELWDDRAVQVEANTGALIGRSTRGLT